MGRGVTVMAERSAGGGTSSGPSRGQRRYLVRATRYGYGVWDTVAGDWWVPRLDMSRRDAGEIVEELEARRRAAEADEQADSPEDDPG